ncbi:SPOR domain-containing protein [Acidovorax sp.]|uniref:SPOR domain-containing protein n=1 Tax=Acidovorax sp. TaxID=1872122 RepID=UPI002ACEF5F1|nr:SPOR domain-containing protein [Acidovorax sp.]MDZ7866942.1 SPOR domain-containing protein [Acidovorax sp.]
MPLTLDPANAIAPMSLDSPSDNAMTALYRVALGPVNAEHYLPIFARFDDAGRTTTTWNWPAALFTLSWLVFRQLWGVALVYVAAAEGLALLVFGLGRQFLHWPQPVEWGILAAIALFSCALPGLFANAVLHTEVRKRIARALSVSRTVPEAAALLERQASSRQRLSAVIIGHVVVVATALLAYLLFPPGAAPEQGGTAATNTPPPAVPAPNPTSGLAAVSVARAASTAASGVASDTVSAPRAAAPTSAEVPPTPAAVVPAPAVATPPSAPPIAAAPPKPAPAKTPAPVSAASPAGSPAKAPLASAKPAPAASKVATPVATPAPPKATAPVATAASKPSRPVPATKERPVATAASSPASLASGAEPPMVGSAPGFYINVGLFAEEANARKTQSRLLNEGLPAFRQPLESAKGTRIRVRVGPFDSKAEADTAAQTIQRMGLEAVVFKK